MIKLPFNAAKPVTFTPEQDAEIDRRIKAAIALAAPVILELAKSAAPLAERRSVRR